MNIKTTLTALFVSSIVVANVTASKLAFVPIPHMGDVAVPAGFVAFGVAFLCSDLIVEYYGKDYASQLINSTCFALVAGYGLILVSIALPSAPFYNPEAFNTVMGSSGAIIVASVVTLLLSQHIDVRLFSRLREATNGRWKFVRNCGSTGVSQMVDTVVFITLGFAVFPYLQGGEPMVGMALVSTIVGQYVAKVAVAIMDTPVFYMATWVIDRE